MFFDVKTGPSVGVAIRGAPVHVDNEDMLINISIGSVLSIP